jgi:phosphoribosylamine--glycine ligase
MQKYNIPTAQYNSFSSICDALNFLENCEESKKLVIKADGLAGGKGVCICNTRKDAKDVVNKMMNDKILGDAGTSIIIEEYIDGPELSYLVFTDGVSYSIMPSSQDHKRIGDNDQGRNTGGMGAYAPAPLATNELNRKIEKDIIKKVIYGINTEKLKYKGVLYIGIIMNGSLPYVLEFNCRFGDPETQAILPLLNTDLADICTVILNQKLSSIKINWKKEFSVCVVLASNGYPEAFKKGFRIKGLECINDKSTVVFHAGTELKNGKFITSGGRVLGITSTATEIKSCIEKVYKNVGLIHFKNMYYRRDIGRRALILNEKYD